MNTLGNPDAPIKDVITAGQEFMCLLYGSNVVMPMNQLRHKIFSSKKTTPQIKSLPPTDAALEAHILRAHVQCMLWKAADANGPPEVDYSKFGWEQKDNILQPVTGVKVACAPELMKVVACGCASAKPCSRASCSCKAAGLSCTTYCKCSADLVCQNEHTKHEEDSDDVSSDSEDEDTSSDDDE